MSDQRLAPAVAVTAWAPGLSSRARGWFRAFVGSPAYPANAADLRQVELLGLRLPLRTTAVLAAMVMVILFDYSRTFVPRELIAIGQTPDMQRLQSLDRLVLWALVPLLIVVVGFRDRVAQYGVGLGNWRWGIGLTVAGCVVMTPFVLAVAGAPDFRAYYAPSWSSLPDVLVTNGLDQFSAEFLLRGFLMLTLVRAIGPIGVLVATLPFVFMHVGKPELELLSTLGGGMAYGWLTWRTGSIVWGALAHTYIMTLVIWAAAVSL